MRNRIVNLFEMNKGFKTLERPKNSLDNSNTSATDFSSKKTIPTTIEKKERFMVRKNRVGEYVLAKLENGIEVDSHTFPNIKILKNILNQDAFKNLDIDYRISNDEEYALKAIEKPSEPQEAPLDINFGISHLLNNRDMGNKTFINSQEKQEALSTVVKNIKTKLMNKDQLINEIRELKSSEIVNNVAEEFMNGAVFKDALDLTSNIVRFIHYLVYEELTKYLVVNNDTKLLKGPKSVKTRGGDISSLIKELAKEIMPTFERYLNRKEKSELFTAFQEIK